jgi:hypothetical protein
MVVVFARGALSSAKLPMLHYPLSGADFTLGKAKGLLL